MKKRVIRTAAAVLALMCVLSACGNTDTGVSESAVPDTLVKETENTAKAETTETSDVTLGVVTEPNGSIESFSGWWYAGGSDTDIPFVALKISDGGAVVCYDQSGGIVDVGNADYDEKRALNGNSLIVFSFDSIGEYGAFGYAVGTESEENWLEIPLSDEFSVSFRYFSDSPFDTGAAQTDDSSDLLISALGSKMDGKALLDTGEEIIGGETCKTFALGANTPERFVAEQHFAVTPSGDIYTMDVLQGPDWIPWASDSDRGEPSMIVGTLYAPFGEPDIREIDFGYEEGTLTPEKIAEALSEWTGLSYDITATVDGDAVIVDWKSSSSFAEGQPPEPQKEGFEFYDQETMRWFMLNSLCSSIRVNMEIENVYFSIEGEDLNDLGLDQDFNPAIPYNKLENDNIVIK